MQTSVCPWFSDGLLIALKVFVDHPETKRQFQESKELDDTRSNPTLRGRCLKSTEAQREYRLKQPRDFEGISTLTDTNFEYGCKSRWNWIKLLRYPYWQQVPKLSWRSCFEREYRGSLPGTSAAAAQIVWSWCDTSAWIPRFQTSTTYAQQQTTATSFIWSGKFGLGICRRSCIAEAPRENSWLGCRIFCPL